MDPERIVIGVDFSEPSRAAAQWAVSHLAAGAEVVLAHVIALPEPPAPLQDRYPRRELMMGTLREGAEKQLRELGEAVAHPRAWLEVREAPSVREGLTAIAREYEAGLIVLGAHGDRRGLSAVLGTTAQHVVREADVPVLVVRSPAAVGVRRILVPVDDETMARYALRVAGRLHERLGAEVSTIHVQPLALAKGRAGDAIGESDRWRPLAALAGIPAERAATEVVAGNPVIEIVDAAARLDADMIVMGRSDAGGLRRAVLGGVTDGVLRGAGCSVLIVPEPVDELLPTP